MVGSRPEAHMLQITDFAHRDRTLNGR